ncbi:hypothetical protein AWM75_07345 [Aerococcus urinaehominis]|uniref:Uncharacterized protein n=1 Tax=Aerococcus urinaehominis TaxID=128944 RepID=A0A120IB12_9LACT|nr:peptidase U32 family protein [Aerococcus urinaehominis]AMB99788.1 hypothetical protein AWM75_07345 [Aerococcus urinaehominis]SDM08972.1 Collagenase-like protease, PrtC family [Aerococcus urinaehominis]
MIELIATAESLDQARQLVDIGVDYLVVGEKDYGLRLPGYLTFEEIQAAVDYAHQAGKKVIVAANAILHNDKIKTARAFLKQVQATGADLLMVGDTGLIQILKDSEYRMPYIYDAAVLVTSPGQVNFWAKYGAVASLVAREVPYAELVDMAQAAQIPLIVQTYGASCIHQSGRLLLDNYFNFIGKDTEELEGRQLFLSEPNKPDTHYSVYQDSHGTHIFANNDLDLIQHLDQLTEIGINHWYNDGVLCPGQDFVDINQLFVEARDLIAQGLWHEDLAQAYDEKLAALHPANRELSTGFFLYAKDKVQ